MTLNYSFLKDETAINEIRKHKWIESQKNSTEIGFASAAIDWINNHGNAWLISKLNKETISNSFIEKRTSRRIKANTPVIIKSNNREMTTTIRDINLIGFTCLTPNYQVPGCKVNVSIHFQTNKRTHSDFQFETTINRVSLHKNEIDETEFELFLHLNEKVRNYLRLHAESINF